MTRLLKCRCGSTLDVDSSSNEIVRCPVCRAPYYPRSRVISGDVAFKLKDTCGLPVEIQLEVAQENGFTIDMQRYLALLEAQRDMSRSAG